MPTPSGETKTSTQRSVAYYQEPEGKVKKQALNARRRKSPQPPAPPSPVPPGLRPFLQYLCVMVGLIEGRRVQSLGGDSDAGAAR